MRYYCPNRNPHSTHIRIVAKPRICKYCGHKMIYWKCSCGASVNFDPLEEGKYGDHRFSCPETYEKNPFKTEAITQMKRVQIKEWDYESEFLDILEEYEMVFNTSLPLLSIKKFYYCGTCTTYRPIDSTIITRNGKNYIWCQCGKQKSLEIPFFGEKQVNFLTEKIRLCKRIILNYIDLHYNEIPPLIYFGSQITSFLEPEDSMTFMFINNVYQYNFEKIKTPPKSKYQIFLRKMIGL